ncbi:MAG: hypothetical protein KAY59_01070 [Acidobacteria bacterium]|jgi:hypothetical protein|nr:hypothetical protein [Acidobacteriota bacterium]MDQ5980554.1 hypothetical protein [Verrucomicrobiota bacterium]
MTITRRQLFATLAAAVTAPFLPKSLPPLAFVPSSRQAAFVAGEDVYVAWLRLNRTYYCEHPGKSVRITSIDR